MEIAQVNQSLSVFNNYSPYLSNPFQHSFHIIAREVSLNMTYVVFYIIYT